MVDRMVDTRDTVRRENIVAIGKVWEILQSSKGDHALFPYMPGFPTSARIQIWWVVIGCIRHHESRARRFGAGWTRVWVSLVR